MILRKAVALITAIGMAVIVSSANADIIRFDIAGIGGAGLLTTNELHGPSGNATGGERGLGILYDDVTMDLMVDVGWGTGN